MPQSQYSFKKILLLEVILHISPNLHLSHSVFIVFSLSPFASVGAFALGIGGAAPAVPLRSNGADRRNPGKPDRRTAFYDGQAGGNALNLIPDSPQIFSDFFFQSV